VLPLPSTASGAGDDRRADELLSFPRVSSIRPTAYYC
jgi:hypothetical protein